MSASDEINALKEKIAELTEMAKQEALDAANAAIAALNELGFEYRLVEPKGKAAPATKAPSAPGAPTGTRRTGIREEVLKVIEENPGLARAAILTRMDATDKSAIQSVSNALSALKKAGTIESDGKGYKAR